MKRFILKFLLIVLFATVLSSIATESSFAAKDDSKVGVKNVKVGAVPGSNNTLMSMQANRAEGRKLRDKALSMEIIRKPESLSDMVCLPKLLGNFSGLGLAFTDLKELFNFDLSASQVCNLVMGVQSGFGAKLNLLLKVAASGLLGLNLPALSICTGEMHINIPINLGLSLGAATGMSIKGFGCAINVNAGVQANGGLSAFVGAGLPSLCIDIDILPQFECTAIGDLLGGPHNKNRFIPIDPKKLGKILPGKGGGVNAGVAYATADEQANLALGGDYDLGRALGLEDITPAVSAISGFQIGYKLDYKKGWDSEDGLSSDNGVASNWAANVMAGYGANWKDTYKMHSKPFGDAKKDEEQMKRGPGSIVNKNLKEVGKETTENENKPGTAVWKVSPSLSAGTNINLVIDSMKIARAIDPTYDKNKDADNKK